MWARTIDGGMADFNDRYDEDLDPKLDDPRWSGDEKPRRRQGARRCVQARRSRARDGDLRLVGCWVPFGRKGYRGGRLDNRANHWYEHLLTFLTGKTPMEPSYTDQVSGGAGDQSRREALKRFGRYAAMAPTAMVLLQPRDSLAKPDKHGKGGKGYKGGRRGWGGRGGRGGDGY
jgi:hypothetical protein